MKTRGVQTLKAIKATLVGRNNAKAMRTLQREVGEEVRRALTLNTSEFTGTPILPPKYGRGMPERAVELLLARLTYKPGCQLLDVGHANAMECHRELVLSLPNPRHLTGIDIADPVYPTQAYYERSVKAGIVESPLDDASFDVIWCISTLEHFGMDCSHYTDGYAVDDKMDFTAINSMVNLLRPGGTLLVTVPYGKAENHGWLRNYDAERWQALLDSVAPKTTRTENYYRHTYGAGWTSVPPEELQYVGYYDQKNYGAGGLAAVVITRR